MEWGLGVAAVPGVKPQAFGREVYNLGQWGAGITGAKPLV